MQLAEEAGHTKVVELLRRHLGEENASDASIVTQVAEKRSAEEEVARACKQARTEDT